LRAQSRFCVANHDCSRRTLHKHPTQRRSSSADDEPPELQIMMVARARD